MGHNTVYYSCKFSDPALSRFALIAIERDVPSIDPTVATEQYSRLPTTYDLLDALRHAARAFPDRHILVIRNPKIYAGAKLLEALNAATDAYGDGWSMVSGAGLGVNGERYIAHYAADAPALSYCPERRVILDSFPDAYLLNKQAVAEYLQDAPGVSTLFEPWFIHESMKSGRLAFFDARLGCPVNGDYLGRDYERLTVEFEAVSDACDCDKLPTFAGDLVPAPPRTRKNSEGEFVVHARENVSDFTRRAVMQISERMTVSVVVRTIFKRTYLLHRLLASIVRATVKEVDVEVVLSTDIEADMATKAFEETQRRFGNLNLKLVRSAPEESPIWASRVRNLIQGAKAATHEYLWFMDDDDYIDLYAFTHLSTQLYDGVRPIFFTAAEVHNEKWQEGTNGKAVLSQSERRGVWSAAGWRSLFSGVNRVPVCGIIAPRDRFIAAFDSIPMHHNLSEDYMMHLMMMLGKNLPLIVELDRPFSHISMRGLDENTMNASDRTNWCLDIFGFLQDLMLAPGDIDRSVLRILAQPQSDLILQSENAQLKTTIKDLVERNQILNRQISILSDALHA